MAGNIPMGSMSTEIKLNGSQSVKTLRELKQAVTQATSAWKAQRAELASIGKSTEAAESKFKGLGESIKKQKDYITGLQEAQKHLTEAQKSVDKSTREGRQEYGKYNEALQKNETRIHSAEQKLVSLTNQQTKAKSSLNYYKSGLADVQKQLKTNESVAKSYVVRLKAEGKGYESAKAKLNSYKDSLANLRKQQSIQTSELSRIARETGKSSDAYKRQEVRVNQTATSIAKLNGKIKSSQTEVNKLNPHGFNKLANGAKHVTSAADKMKSGLKNAWASIKSGATAAATGIGAVGAAAISGAKKAGNLQQVYKEITNLAVTGGEKQREAIKNVTAMQRQGRDMSIQYGKSQQDIAEAFEDLVKRGYTTKQALGAMRTELQGSVASGDDFKDVVSVSSTTLESFGMRADTTAKMTRNTKRAVNELAYAADMTSTGFKDLGYGMSYVGSSAHQAGFSLSETAAAMGVLSNNGLEASKAGTGLNQVINRLSDATGNLLKGDKKNALAKLGIKPKEITDSTGKLKSLTTVFGVLNKHMKGMSKVQKINIMKSLFGMTGEQAGLILANNSKYLGQISKQVLNAGKKGDYVAQLSKKNSQTAQMQMARAKRAMEAFTMTLGSAMLPAINKAGNSLAKFLNSKDGEKFQKNVGGAVSKVANGIVGFIEFITKHPTETKAIATGLGAAYGAVKLASFVQWLNKTRLAMSGLKVGTHLINGFNHLGSAAKISGKLIKATGKGIAFAGKTMGKGFIKQLGLIGKGIKGLGSGILKAAKAIGSKALSAGKLIGSKITQGIKATTKFSMGKRLATGALAGAAVATPEAINAVKDRHSANKRSQDIGGAVGALVGGTLTSMIPVVGPMLAPVGAIIGKYAGRWGGQAVNNFTKGWQKNKPPKKFWSLENLGWSTHNMFRQVGKWGAGVGKNFAKGINKGKSFAKRNSKELALTAVSPLLGIPALLYKNNPKFRKWANGVGKSIKSGLSKAGKAVNHFKSSLSKNFKKAWDNVYKHSSKGTKQIMRSVSRFAKSYIKTNSKANKETIKNFASFSKRLKKNHGDLFKTIGQTAKKQLAIEKRRWSANWKNISRIAKGIWNGIRKNASDLYKKLNSATHGGLGKVFSGFKSFGKSIAGFWTDLWKNVNKTFSDTIKGLKDAANNVGKFFTGKLKVGSLHLASGTDWKHKYGYPAVLNDGSDSPATGNREGILNPDGSVEVQQGVNVPRWIFPWQDVINARDMARIFGRSVRLANGTVNLHSLETNDPTKLLSTLTKLAKKKYDEDRQRHEKQKQRHDRNDNDRATERKRLIKQEHDVKAERAKIAKEIRVALSKGRNTKGLTAQFNALTKHISNIKHSIAKTNPHHGQVYVDEGLLIGAKSRIGKSKWISDALFKKLTTKPKKRKTAHKRASTRKHRTTRKRSYSSRSYSSVSVPKVRVSNVSVGVSSKSVTVSAKVVGTKNVKALEKAMKRIKGGTRKITVKAQGGKSLKSLAKTVKKIKGKTSYVKVKTSGTHSLKSLGNHIASVHERVNSLNKSAKKTKFGTDIAKQAEKATKALKGEGNFAKVINIMSNKSTKDFKNMVKSINKDTNKIRKSTESDFSNMYRKSYSSMNRLHSGVIRLAKSTASGFGNAMKKMVSYASDSMKGTIRQINRGIRGIDRVLKQFGGNSSVINPVHFAGGTDASGRLAQDTLAVVNDAETGPRQEAVITDQNDIIIPHGNNRKMLLRKGWGVLNGVQTQSLSLPHFAKGTGIKKDALRKLAENSLRHFAESFKNMFTQNLHDVGSDLTQGATDLSKNSGTHYGNPWSQAMWTVINKAIGSGGGSRAAFLRYAKETFDGVKYLMGAASKTLSDCSGMVMQALRHFGIDIGRTTVDMANSPGTKYLGKSLSKTEPGDLVIFGHGTGAAGHVGIINNPAKGTMFNETPPYARISKISDAMSMGYGYYRVKALHDQAKHQPKIKPSLLALAKRELGGKALNWISDHLSENEGSTAGKPTGDHLHWLKQAGIPESWWSDISWIINKESGWNPRAYNPTNTSTGHAYGIAQITSQQWGQYYARHGHDWRTNPIAQLMGMKDYIHGRYGTAARAKAWWESHGWYANGGIANKPSIFGEAGPEMAIPLIPSKSTRAWELIGKAIGILSSQTNLQVQNVNNEKERKEEHDFRQAVLLLLTQLVNKSNVADIKLKTPQGRTLWEVIEPFSKAEQRAAMIKLRRGLSGR